MTLIFTVLCLMGAGYCLGRAHAVMLESRHNDPNR